MKRAKVLHTPVTTNNTKMLNTLHSTNHNPNCLVVFSDAAPHHCLLDYVHYFSLHRFILYIHNLRENPDFRNNTEKRQRSVMNFNHQYVLIIIIIMT